MGIITDSLNHIAEPVDVSVLPGQKIYLSGPMRNKPDLNIGLFDLVALELREGGHTVFSPAETFDRDYTKDFATYMREDYKAILEADRIVMLPGWQDSEGARLEYQVAKSLGLEISYYGNAYRGDPVELAAASIVRNGEREAVYGHPGQDFARTGQYWGVKPHEVALRMIQLKISRLLATPDHEDSWKDIIGYAICGVRIMLEKEGYAGADA